MTTQYPDKPPDSCTEDVGEVRRWLFLRDRVARIRTGRAFGHTTTSSFLARYIWHEGGEFHVALWRHKRWLLTLHGPDLKGLIDYAIKTYGWPYSPGNNRSVAEQAVGRTEERKLP